MRDAVVALESAVRELQQAAESLPADMSDEVRAVTEKAEKLLEALRSKVSAEAAEETR